VNIPKNNRKQKKVEKVCKYPGCDTIFFGIAVSKYCPEHRQEKYRIRKSRNVLPVEENNVIISHSFSIATERIQQCGLEGCTEHFSVVLLPKQKVYAKYCPEHRNEFRRQQFIRQHSAQAGLCG